MLAEQSPVVGDGAGVGEGTDDGEGPEVGDRVGAREPSAKSTRPAATTAIRR